MVGRPVPQAGERDGLIAGVVVGTILLVEAAMLGGARLVPKLGIQKGEIVVRGDVLGVDREGLLEAGNSVAKVAVPLGAARGTALGLRPFEEGASELVDDLVVPAEVEVRPSSSG